MGKVYLGADLGGTNLRAGVRAAGADAGGLLDQETTAASPGWSPADLVGHLSSMLERMTARHPVNGWEVAGIGFGLTGDIDYRAGSCHSMRRFPNLEGACLGSILRERFRTPVYLLNDGLAATLAELRAGAGRRVHDFVMITLGTGIGGGVVLDGQILAGARGRIGKVGHQILDLDGPVHCHCGLRGCWQSLAAKEGVVARARAMSRRHPGSALAEVVAASADIGLQTVADLARQGDPASQALVEETGRYVGVGLANLIKIFAPQQVILGGGIAEGNSLLLAAVERTIREYAIKPYQVVHVVPARFGQNAGVVGATFLAEGNCLPP